MSGKLFVVATPIGNLDDMTPRAVQTLNSVSLIATEDTRHTKKLLNHFDIHTKVTSYHNYNESGKSGSLVEFVLNGGDLAIVSDAGTPTVSDPGYRLISAAVEAEIEVVPIPGVTAAMAAMSVSGLPSDRFLFIGFLPDKPGKRRKKLEEICSEKATLIFYISKWKVEKTLVDMIEVLGDRRICYCRELTKMHEDIRHTKLTTLLEDLKDKTIKGEITMVVEGLVT